MSAAELDRVFGADAASGDSHGYAVDIDGNRAVVGSRLDDDTGNGAGAAYVYLRNSATGLWEQEDKLVMSSAAAGDQFGASVAIEGDVIVIGAPQDDVNEVAFKGSAHVFTRGPGGWGGGVELLPGDESTNTHYENYGISVAIDNGTIVVGVAYDDEKNDGNTSDASGSAYVFEKSGDHWLMTARLLPPSADAHQNFGWSVAIDSSRILVGAPHWTGLGVGEVYQFGRLDSTWGTQGTQLPATDNLAGDEFGWSVAISGDIAVVGARMDDDVDNGIESGSITIFDRSSGSWINKGKKTATAGDQGDRFGAAVATNGEAVIAGAQLAGNFSKGAIYSFSDTGSDWVENVVGWPVSPASNPANVSAVQQFGTSIALDGASMIVGAPTSDVYNGSSFVFVSGAAFFYGLNATAIPTIDGTGLLAIQSPPGSFLSNVIAIDPATLGGLPEGISAPQTVSFPQSISFPLGALGFNVNGLTPGASIEVEIQYPQEVPVSGYYKFSDGWYEFLDDGSTGATVTPGKVVLKLIDGGRGDHDGIANGVIVDPGALSAIVIGETVFEDGFEN